MVTMSRYESGLNHYFGCTAHDDCRNAASMAPWDFLSYLLGSECNDYLVSRIPLKRCAIDKVTIQRSNRYVTDLLGLDIECCVVDKLCSKPETLLLA